MTLFFRKIIEPTSSHQAPFYELTDPGIGQGCRAQIDSYQSSVVSRQPSVESAEKNSWGLGFFARRRVLKEALAIVEKMGRLENAPGEAIRYFFRNDLPKLVAASQTQPEKIGASLRAFSAPKPWLALARLACGDVEAFVQALETVPRDPAYLFALEAVAASRPREAGHLLAKFFEKADLKGRMAALRTAVVSENLGDGHLIGEFFVKLMAATTREERRDLVEPTLESLLLKTKPANPAASGKLSWLNAYYHGWMQEQNG